MMNDAIMAETPVAELPRDADGDIDRRYVERVARAIGEQDSPALKALVGDLHEADVGELIEALDPEDRPRLVELMGADFDFTALTELDETTRVQILDELEPQTVAEGVRDLESDDAVYILEDLDREDQAEILERLPTLERTQLEKSLDYPEGSAGRRMQTDFLAIPNFWTVGQTIDHLRERDDLPERFYEILVIDPAYRLVGVVPLDRFVRMQRAVKLADIVDEDRHVVRATDSQEDVAWEFEHYNLVSAPVLDEAGRLVGIITVDDVVDVMAEEADSEIKALGGVRADEELSDDVWTITKSRFLWLFVNLLTAILASVVIGVFEGSLQQMVALAVLMPIVASMGGNAGTQTMTVAVRALATEDLGRANAWRIIRRELLVGALNGLAFAIIMGVVAWLWFDVPGLLPVIGLALVVTLVAAALGGILIPLALDRMNVDPAVSSGPLVTTITDVVGFFSFLGIATLWFGLR